MGTNDNSLLQLKKLLFTFVWKIIGCSIIIIIIQTCLYTCKYFVIL